MTALGAALTAFSTLVLAVWASRLRQVRRERRSGFRLSEAYDCGPGPWPPISVMVAAKDERDNIADCLTSLLAQDYPNFEVIAVNDRSTDGTGEIMERLARDDQRLKVIHVRTLPAGWNGKSHAMYTAAAAAAGQWLCMTDADCRQTSTQTLRLAVAYARRCGADLLSILPNMDMRTFWENAVQPVCSGIMMIWFRPEKVNDPRRPHAYANGAFILMRRSAYEAVGTHQAIRNRLNEDMHLAARTKGAGLNLRVVSNHGLYRVRMYTSFVNIFRGWSRIFYGTFGTFRRLAISLALLVVMGFGPYVAAAVALIALAAGAAPAGWLWTSAAVSAAAALLQIWVIAGFLDLLGGRRALAFGYPLGCAVAAAALVGAIAKLRPGAHVNWRGTAYARRDKFA